MAPRKRYAPKRRIQRKRKYIKRGYKKAAAAKVNLKNNVHYFQRRVNLGTIVSTGINQPTLTSLSFNLNQLPNVGEFTTLFDQFKMTHVKLFFKLNQDPSTQTAGNSFYPTMYYCPDHDDVTPPTSIDDLRQHGRTKMVTLRPSKYTVVNIKPSVLNQLFRIAGQTTVQPKWRQWIDMAHPDTSHYGLKYAFDNAFNINSNYSVEVQAQYWFQCRDVR